MNQVFTNGNLSQFFFTKSSHWNLKLIDIYYFIEQTSNVSLKVLDKKDFSPIITREHFENENGWIDSGQFEKKGQATFNSKLTIVSSYFKYQSLWWFTWCYLQWVIFPHYDPILNYLHKKFVENLMFNGKKSYFLVFIISTKSWHTQGNVTLLVMDHHK